MSKTSVKMKRDLLKNFIRRIKANAIPIGASLVLSLLVTLALLYYASSTFHFSSLAFPFFTLDFTGFYSVQGALADLTPRGLLYALTLLLGLGNYYAGFYLYFFIGCFLNLLGAYYLAVEIFKKSVDEKNLYKIGVVASLLFLFNPTVLLRNNVISLFSNIDIYGAALFVFFIELIRFFRTRNDYSNFMKRDCMIMGISLGIGLSKYPNAIRVLLIAYSAFFLAVVLKYLFEKIKNLRAYVGDIARVFLLFLVTTIVGGAYTLLPVLLSLSSTLTTSSYAVTGFLKPILYTNDLNTIFYIFIAGSRFLVSYSTLLSGITYFSALAWPVFALLLPFLLFDRKNYGPTVLLELILIAIIFWNKGGNPPLGGLYLFVASHLPFSNQLIPIYSPITFLIFGKLYAVLAGASVVYVALWTSSKIKPSRRKLAFNATVLFLALLLILQSALPFLNGQMERGGPNATLKGYVIPQEYQIVKNYLAAQNQSAIIMPATDRYASTSWGYSGSTDFYNRFFYPSIVYVINTFGTYAVFTPANLSNYINLTTPITPADQFRQLFYNYGTPQVNGVNFTLTKTDVVINPANQTNFSVAFPLQNKLNINGFTLVDLQFRVSNLTAFWNIINSSGLRIGFRSFNQSASFYPINSLCQLCFINETDNGWFNISLMVVQNGDTAPTPSYDAGNVTAVKFLFNTIQPPPRFSISFPNLYGVNKIPLTPGWFTYIKRYNVNYILVDKSFTSGTTETYGYVNATLQKLISSGHLNMTYDGNYLSLYKIQ